MVPLVVLGGVLLFVLISVVGMANRVTRLRNLCDESWAQLDVALKRRHDLIPNLVAVCKAAAAHEKAVLERIAALHAETSRSGVNARAESELGRVLGGFLARAEAYPELRSNQHFLLLQQELVSTEDRIAAARRFYNANVRDHNIAIEQFPTALVAGGVSSRDYFEAGDVSQPDLRDRLEGLPEHAHSDGQTEERLRE